MQKNLTMEYLQSQTDEQNGKAPVAGKPNILIESRQGFKNIHEYRLFLGMLYMAYDGIDITKPFELDISFIIAGRSGQEYECLKDACTNIMSRVVNLLPNESKRFKLRHLVDKADYDELARSGKLKVSFHPDVVPHILNMFKEGKYTKVFLKHALPIRSLYSVRLYELLLQYKNIGSRNVSLESLRFFLDIPDNKFVQWINIKQKILEPAKKHLQQYTDICFEYSPIKKGTKVTEIHFEIIENIPDYNSESEQLDLFENSKQKKSISQDEEYIKIVKENIWKESQEEVLANHSKEKITWYYKYCKQLESKGKKISDFKSFFYTALCEDKELFEDKILEKASREDKIRAEKEIIKAKSINEEIKYKKAEKYFLLLPQEIRNKYLNMVPSFIPKNLKDGTAVSKFMEELESIFKDDPNNEIFLNRVAEYQKQ